MPRSLGGAIAAIFIGLALALWLSGLAAEGLSTLLLLAGWILVVLGVAAVIYLLVNGRRTRL